jgi:hypothetical protein
VPYVPSAAAALVTVFLIAVAGKAAGRGSFKEFTGSVAAMRVLPSRVAAAAAVTMSAEAPVIALAASRARSAKHWVPGPAGALRLS